ncbi:MAG TPA: glycosyltransferase [Chthoniobacteraceae bacterium]|nr:glycosyltransferase [Chthoniobacteraceae bacterium]
MLDLLILTAGYGEGHNAAARGLLAASQQLGYTAEIADSFTALGSHYDRSRKQYIDMINRIPKLWAFVYGWVDRIPAVEFQLPLLSGVIEELSDTLTLKQPQVVVSVYPLYSYFIRRLYPRSKPFGFHTVITDSITINRVWHRAPSDSYLVPNDDTAAVLREQGLPPARIHTLGFPVNPRFAADRPKRPSTSHGPRVLFMINAGKETAPGIIARLLEIHDIHLTVTVGKDEELRRRVEEAAAGRPIEILGWISNMPELLMTHHVLIGKAGGATVQEAIAARTPMIITQVVPGQEEGNAQLLFENGCGALCSTPATIAHQIEELFADKGRVWNEWHDNIGKLSHPDAALKQVEWMMANAGVDSAMV